MSIPAWEYATVLIHLKREPAQIHPQATENTPEVQSHITLRWDHVGDAPDGQEVRGLEYILNAWGAEGWELVSIVVDRISGTVGQKEIQDSPGAPEISPNDIRIDAAMRHAIFKRIRSS